MIWLKRCITRRNVLIFLAGVFFLIAWNREVNLLYSMFALVSATIIVAVILPHFALKRIGVSRQIAVAAFEGEEIEVSVTMVNQGRAARFMLEALDAIPAAAPDEREPLVFAARLAGRTERTFTYRLVCYKRGFYTMGPLRLRSAYPLGIAWSEREGDSSQPALLVYPSMFEIASIPLMAAGSLEMSSMESLARAGGSDDFFGTREYRQGDSLRHIHWPSTARHDRLIVKEFEVRASTETSIILDLHQESNIGEERETTLEYAVRIAASISRYGLERGHSVQLTGYGRQSTVVHPGRGMYHLSTVLDALARVEADGTAPYHETIGRAARFLKDGSTAVLFFSDGMNLNEYSYSLELLRVKRIRLLVIFFEQAGFSSVSAAERSTDDRLRQELFAQGAAVYTVTQGDDLTGVFV